MGGFSYPNEFAFDMDPIPSAVGTGVIGAFVLIYLLVLFLSLLFSVAMYVLQSLGMYTIAQRRGIRNSFLAWVPVVNLWILGSISDQYQYLVKGKVKNRRKALLVLGIGMFVLYFIWFAGIIISVFTGEPLTMLAGMLGGSLLMIVVAIFLLVLQYMAYYDLFTSCQPSNGVLYLILSILFPVTLPFFVFACRKKDLGMPPRKQPAPQQVVVPTVEVVVDPNVVEKVVVPTVEVVVDPNVVEKVVVPTVEPVVESAAEPVAEGFANPEEFEEE